MQKMVVGIGLIGLVFLLGCSQNIGSTDTTNYKDCGTDQACLQASFKNCEWAKGTVVDEKATVYGELRGKTSDGLKCRVYMRLDKAEGAPDLVLGKDALCEVSFTDPTVDFTTIDVAKDCKGPLAEIYGVAKPFLQK